MRIGLIGLTYNSGNKGCEALSYAFLEILNRIAKDNNIDITASLIEAFPTRLWLKNNFSRKEIEKKYFPVAEFSNVSSECIFYKRFGNKIVFDSKIKKCDCVFDFTYGDSFTDIYGEERFFYGTSLKNKVMKKGIPFILGSQTIGPFNNVKIEKMAVEVIRMVREVYVRDYMSFEYTKKISGRTPLLTTDVAFALPFEQQNRSENKIRVGFNPSGLLWNGGYTRDNQFGLSVEYKQFCRKVIDTLLSNGKEVHLILHAYTQDLSRPDNDLIAVKELHEEFPDTIVSPEFRTPMEAKSYISGMNVFIGARMHATIGAFSAGVPVIPFSYSRKFEGLFHSLKYDCIIHGCQDTTEEAIEKAVQWANDPDLLKSKMTEGEQLAKEKTEFLQESYFSVMKDYMK